MRCLTLLTLAAALGGCAPAAPPAVVPARPVVTPPDATPPVNVPKPADAPKASDPKARELVTQALDAHTKNDRAAVRLLRTVEMNRVGLVAGLEPQRMGIDWTMTMAWPGRLHVQAEFPGERKVYFALDGATAWQQNERGQVSTSPAPEALDLQRDATGEWLWLLFPMLDDEAMVTPADPYPAAPDLKGVNLFHPKLAPAVVYFHPETKLLTRILFEGVETGQTGLKEYEVITHADYDGIQLPSRLAQKFKGQEYANWQLTKLKPLATVDDALFKPKAAEGQ